MTGEMSVRATTDWLNSGNWRVGGHRNSLILRGSRQSPSKAPRVTPPQLPDIFWLASALKSHGSEIVFTSRLGEITQRIVIITGGLYISSLPYHYPTLHLHSDPRVRAPLQTLKCPIGRSSANHFWLQPPTATQTPTDQQLAPTIRPLGKLYYHEIYFLGRNIPPEHKAVMHVSSLLALFVGIVAAGMYHTSRRARVDVAEVL